MTDSGRIFRFPKKEKLTGKKEIEELFKNGSSFHLHPFLVKYRKEPNAEVTTHRVLFTVSKRNFKSAVKRNLLKRRMREAYRLNKSILPEPSAGTFYQIAFVYLPKTLLPYREIEPKLKQLLERLKNQHFSEPSTSINPPGGNLDRERKGKNKFER